MKNLELISQLLTKWDCISQDCDNYKDRKVAFNQVGELGVSTVFTSDEGFETAIIDSDGEVYPVERYPSNDKKFILLKHKNWCKKAITLKVITELNWGTLTKKQRIKLKR